MRHDPQRTAAAYLGGQLPRRHRDRFEAHLLACEACWREVQAGRRGRALAEAAREVAPQHLRERVRATIEATPLRPPRWRPRPWVAVTVLAVAAVLGGGLLAVREPRTQPAPIAAAVASYQAGGGTWSGPTGPPPAQQLGDLRWHSSGHGTLGGLPVVAHTYQDAAGHRVVLLRADRSFPTAIGARHPATGATWIAEVDGVVLFCADQPAPSLLLGQDQAEVLVAASLLGLDAAGHRPAP